MSPWTTRFSLFLLLLAFRLLAVLCHAEGNGIVRSRTSDDPPVNIKSGVTGISTTRRNVTTTTALPVLVLLDLSSADRIYNSLTTDGNSLLKTAQKAVADVNARRLIPGHHLQLLVNDTKVKNGVRASL